MHTTQFPECNTERFSSVCQPNLDRLIGRSKSAEILILQQFLARNGLPYQILYADTTFCRK